MLSSRFLALTEYRTSEIPKPSRRRMDGPPGVQIVKLSMDLGGDEVYDMHTTHDSTHETIEQWINMIQVDEESHLVEPCEKEILERMRKEGTAVCCALNQPGMRQPLIGKLLLRSSLPKIRR